MSDRYTLRYYSDGEYALIRVSDLKWIETGSLEHLAAYIQMIEWGLINE